MASPETLFFLASALALLLGAGLAALILRGRLAAERQIGRRFGLIGPFGRTARPRSERHFGLRLCRALRFPENDLARTARLVARAGLSGGAELAAWILLGRSAAAAGLMALAALGYAGGWLLGAPLLLVVGLGFAVFVVPQMLLALLAGGRTRRIRGELPIFLDTLVLMLRSGASLDQGLRALAASDDAAFPELNRATRLLVDDLENGLEHEEAFRRWADRLGTETSQELAQMFILHLQLGTEVGRRLKHFADMFVEQRLLDARERSGQRVTQLTALAMVFFLPPLLLVIAGPGVDGLIKGVASVAGGTSGW